MKKTAIRALTLGLGFLMLTGCGARPGLSIVRKIPLPDTYTVAASPEPETETEVTDKESQATAQEEGSIKSLDELKARAVDTGYEVAELLEMQKSFAAGVVDGFDVIINDRHIPVFEFDASGSAQAYADMINEAGYNIAVVNGKFLTMVGASKGVIEDPEEQAVLEQIMDAKAQVQGG